MELDQYDLMYRQENFHWWYVGMRRISEALLQRHFQPGRDRPEILDAGCGSGGTTVWLSRWGRVTGVDLMPVALDFARRRGLGRLTRASVEALPFADASFDLVASFDVLYHLGVQHDTAALAECFRTLKPGGTVLIRVAAHDWLRGSHDVVTHTRHRYTRGELCRKLRAAGFDVLTASYANGLLFPLAPVKRLLERKEQARVADLWLPPPPVNAILGGLLSLEASLVARGAMPFGLSVVAIARKPGAEPRLTGSELQMAGARGQRGG